MSKNWKFGNIGNDVTLAIAVSAGAEAGDVVLTDEGVLAYLVTPPATADGPNAPGLDEGYASARLLPAQGVVELEVEGDPGDPVFVTMTDGVPSYGTDGSAADAHIGTIVAPQGQVAREGHAFVYLGTAGSVAVGA